MEALSVFLSVVFLGTLVYFLVKDPMSFMFFALFLFILGFVLYHFKVIKFKKRESFQGENTPKPSSIDATNTPVGSAEVFYVSDNKFSYNEAESVCKAYGAELATYDDVERAYHSGGEWCGYGWSAGGLALFPTQEDTWKKLQKSDDPEKAKSCGRVGINGGYFDKKMKFGVNCYGVKPQMKPGMKPKSVDKMKTDANLEKIKSMIGTLVVDPFDKSRWSEYERGSGSIELSQSSLSNKAASVNSPTSIERGTLPVQISQSIDKNGGTPSIAPGGLPSDGVLSTSSGGKGGSVSGPSPPSLSTSTTKTETIPVGTTPISQTPQVSQTQDDSVTSEIGNAFTDMLKTFDTWITGDGKHSLEDIGLKFMQGLDSFFIKIGDLLRDGYNSFASDVGTVTQDVRSVDYKQKGLDYLDKLDSSISRVGDYANDGYKSFKSDVGTVAQDVRSRI
jgi:Ca2+/Na+ antiporter